MKALPLAALALVLGVATAQKVSAGNDVEGEFKKFSAIAVEYSGVESTDEFCNVNICSSTVGNSFIDLMWPANGWVKAGVLPTPGRMDENVILCASAIEFVTGLGQSGSSALAGRMLAAASEDGSSKTTIGGAMLTARRTSEGMIECAAARKSPL